MQLFMSLYEGKILNYKHYMKLFFLVPMRKIMQSIVFKMSISKYKTPGNLTESLHYSVYGKLGCGNVNR